VWVSGIPARFLRISVLAFSALLCCLLASSGFSPGTRSRTRAGESSTPVTAHARFQLTPGVAFSKRVPAAVHSLLQNSVFFERNDGQTDRRVKFQARIPGYELFLTAGGLTLSASHPNPTSPARAQAQRPDVLKLSFVGLDHESKVSGVDELPGKVHYLIGKPSQWHTNVPLYRKVSYRHLYPGVDLTYYGNQGQLENDFIVAPHHDPSQISFAVTGAGRPRLSSAGDILIGMPSGSSFEIRKPKAYQIVGGSQKTVDVSYSIRGKQVRFQVGSFDHSLDLIIDPVVLYSTWLGSVVNPIPGVEGGDTVFSVAVDSSGDFWVGGQQQDQSFPVTSGAVNQGSGGFITKIDPTGTTLLYSALFSASVQGIAIDSAGDVYAAAQAAPGFPTTAGAIQQTALNPITDPLIFKLNPAGSAFVYATYLGGSGVGGQGDQAYGIALDSAGDAYVDGVTYSNNFPTANALQPLFGGGSSDGFISKINPTGTALVYSTYLGGTAADSLTSIAVDGNGNAHAIGTSFSTDFPVVNAFQASNNASGALKPDAVVAELNAAGSSLVYSTYLGGTLGVGTSVAEPNDNPAIATDSAGNATVVGTAFSCDFPVQNALESVCGENTAGFGDAFVAKFSPTGSLDFSTFLGLPNLPAGTQATSVALDTSGNIYVGGFNVGDSLPLVSPVQSTEYGPNGAAFVSELDPSGASLLFSSYFGITPEYGDFQYPPVRLGLDGAGNIYLAGSSASDGFPLVDALNPVFPGLAAQLQGPYMPWAVFLAKISPTNAAAAGLGPEDIDFGNQPLGTTSSAQTITLSDLGTGALGLTSISSTGDFQQTNNCGASVTAAGSCTITVTFSPTVAGSRTGSIVVTDSAAGSPQTVMLTGIGGVPVVSLSPTSLTFSNVAVGTSSAPQVVTLTNTGGNDLLIGHIGASGDFTETNTCGTDLPYVNENGSNGTCQINVVFTPTTSGALSGTLSITDNATGSPQVVSLEGNQSASFSLTGAGSSSTSATVTPGQTATFSLNVTGTNGFSGAVNFTCSGAPAGATCTASPNPANISGAAAVPVTVNVITQAATAAVPVGTTWPRLPDALCVALLFEVALAFLLLALSKRRAISRKAIPALLALGIATAICIGCGGGSSPSNQPGNSGTPSGNYTLVLTATSGSVSESMNLTLTVN
jgi:hypothetical protein